MNIDWNAIRARFPVCSRVTYLNPAGGSPMCVDAAIEGRKYFDEMLIYGDSCWNEWLARTDQVRKSLADLLGASREEVGFSPNTSTAMGIIAQLLKDRGAIITMEDEFPSTTFPWINMGCQMNFVPPEKGLYTVDSIRKHLRPEHRILITSYVQYRTGFRQNLAEIGAFCKKSNLIYIVNATQAFGMFPIDVERDEIDFLVFSGLKWACAGYGAAGFYIRKSFIEKQVLPLAGWRSVHEPDTMDNRKFNRNDEASSLESGSPSFPTVFALGGALELIRRIGPENCTNRILYLSQLLEKRLHEGGFPAIYAFDESNRSGIVMIKSDRAKLLAEKLARCGIMVSARGEGLRISVNIFNNEEDINRVVAELGKIGY